MNVIFDISGKETPVSMYFFENDNIKVTIEKEKKSSGYSQSLLLIIMSFHLCDKLHMLLGKQITVEAGQAYPLRFY